ncbi:hypothetical protein DINM_006583 [Dirofilaria immitis]|nr:hypothetical protein [Dirofilaria immitis]
MSGWANYIVQIDLKEIVSCAVYAEELFLVLIKMKQIIKRAHGRNGVADVKLHKAKLLSIGRDGKLCIWERDSALQLLSASKLFTAVEMEWPCRFLETRDQLYVAGFRGVTSLWSITIVDIAFVMYGVEEGAALGPNLHLSNITSITVARSNQNELYVSGGIDTALVLFRLANSGSIEVKQRLQAHSSSVYCVCAMNTYLISAGGKSEIFIWRLEAGNLRQLFNTRMEESYRLLSVQFMSVNPHIRFLDLRNKSDFGFEKHSVLSESFGGNGIMIKISCASFDDGFVCVAISSIGILHIWSFSELIDLKDHRTIEVEKCGLSALSIYIENEFLYIGVGSESGTISIFQVEKIGNLRKVSTVGIVPHVQIGSIHLFPDFQTVSYYHRTFDDVYVELPTVCVVKCCRSSSLIVSTISNNVMKCVVAGGTSICLVYFNDSPPRFIT